MRKLTFILTTIVAVSTLDVGAEAQTIPSWIRPNTIITYNAMSGFLMPTESGGVPVGQATEYTVQYTVGTVSATTVAGTVQTKVPAAPAETMQFSCNVFHACTGYGVEFWVDPADPPPAPPGFETSITGTGPVTVAGRSWTAVTMVFANAEALINPALGVSFVTIFDINSGLILKYTARYPTQEVSLTLTSLAGATLPTTPPAPNPTGPTAATSLVSSVLPSSRSVEVGATATAFSTINTGGNPARAAALPRAALSPRRSAFKRPTRRRTP